jgi:hypothetical protein
VLDNNLLWNVSSLQLVTDNQSTVTQTSTATWDGHGHGPSLYLVH